MSKFVLTAQLQLQAPKNTRQVVSQLQNQLSNVNVNVTAKGSKQATAEVQKLSTATKQAGDRAAAMGRSFAVSFKRFAAFSIATRAVGLFTRGISDAVSEALNFERGLVKVAQVTGKTISELSSLAKEIRGLATSLGVSSSSLLEVSRILSQAGLSADETRVALESLAKSSLAATFDDIVQTTEGAVAIFNQFGAGAAALEGQLGSINAVAGQFAVEAGDLIAVIRRTGGVFKAAGGDLNELIALFTSVRATTRESAESIATGLRTIFTRIQRPSTIKFLESLGIKLTDTEGKFVGGYEAIRLLSSALSELEAGDLRFVQIAEQLGGFRQIGKIIPLLTQFGVAEEALQVAMAGTNSLTKDAATAQQSLLVRVTALKEEFLELVDGMTKSPTFKIMANSAIALASALIKVSESLKHILPLFTALAGMKIIGALSGFAGGFAGTMKGVKGPKAFASGGMVPGTGNRDSVPAMLTPGEFVIRKSSVGKIGANNLEAMNSGNGYADGGSIVGQSKVGTVSADIFGAHDMKLPPQSVEALFDKNPDNAFAFPGGYKKSSIKDSITKRVGAKSPQLPKALQAAEGVLSNNIGNLPKNTTAQGLDDKLSMAFDNALDDGILAGVEATATGFMKKAFKKGGDFKYKSGIPKDEMSKAFNAGAKGSIFEMVVASIAGAPLDNIKNTTMPFDFTGGIGKLSSIYDKVKMPFVDAKITGKATGKEVKIDPITGDVQNLSKNVKPEELAKKVGNQFIMDIADDAHKAAMQIAGQGTEGKNFGGPIKKYATGGAVSDTVPAMLTPGEFVINKKSAQSIGRGNLDRMNKHGVTGFAKGGSVGGVQHFAAGGGVGVGGAMIGAAMLPALVEQIFGPVEGMMKGFLDGLTSSMVMLYGLTKAYAVNKNITQGFGHGLEMAKSASVEEAQASIKVAAAKAREAVADQKALAAGSAQANMSKNLTSAQMKELAASTKTVMAKGKELHQHSAFIAVNATLKAKLKDLITQVSQTRASIKSNLSMDDARIFNSGLKEARKGATSLGDKLMKTQQYLQSFANATVRGKSAQDAAAIATQKVIMGENKNVSMMGKFTAMLGRGADRLRIWSANISKAGQKLQGLNNGAQGLAMAFSIAGQMMTEHAEKQMEKALDRGQLGGRGAGETNDFDQARGQIDTLTTGKMVSNIGDKAMMAGIIGTAILGPIGGLIGAGLGAIFGWLSSDSETERKKQLDKIAKAEMGALQSRIKEEATQMKEAGEINASTLQNMGEDFERAGKLLEDILNEDEKKKATKELDAQILSTAATTGGLAKDQAELEMVIQELSGAYSENKEEVRKAAQAAFNLAKAAQAAVRAQFDQAKVESVFNRASLGVDNFVKSLETGSSRLGPAIAVLEESMKNFAMGDVSGMNIASLRSEAMGSLNQAGVGGGSPIAKSLNNQFSLLEKAVEAQQSLPDALARMEFEVGDTDAQITDTMESALLAAAGTTRDTDIGQALMASVAKLGPDEFNAIRGKSFDFTKFIESATGGLAELGNGAITALKAIEAHEATIAKLTKKRIKLEQDLMQAQRTAIDMHLEAAEIMAEFGGQAVTGDIWKQAALDKMNLATSRMGLGELSTGNAAELSAMSQAITAQFAMQEGRGRVGGGFAGGAGMGADKRKELIQAQKDLASVTREMIALNREELEILQKKNKLEKESLEAAIKGDMEKFLKDSMAVGATAAIAVGNEQMAGQLFGVEAVAGAFDNIKEMQDSGVQSIFGQTLGGPGGVTERAAGQALSMRGIEDPRMAAMLAGSTAEEEALKAQNRALAGTLSTIANETTTMAEMQVASAQIAIDNANVIFNRDIARGNAQLLSRGGVVYASAGFEPRGTDTVPAMLTPGEFVVSKNGVSSGNNRSLLRRMNKGEDVGGGMAPSIDPQVVNKLINGLDRFHRSLERSIDKLNNTKFKIKLDTTNVNVNLNGGNFLATLKDELRSELMADVGEKIKTLKFDESGNASFSDGIV